MKEAPFAHAAQAQVPDCSSAVEDVADGDNDDIPDSADDIDARSGFANELHAQAGVQMQGEPGVRLRLETTARNPALDLGAGYRRGHRKRRQWQGRQCE